MELIKGDIEMVYQLKEVIEYDGYTFLGGVKIYKELSETSLELVRTEYYMETFENREDAEKASKEILEKLLEADLYKVAEKFVLNDCNFKNIVTAGELLAYAQSLISEHGVNRPLNCMDYTNDLGEADTMPMSSL